jgi:uncharacterized membrane protein YgcG
MFWKLRAVLVVAGLLLPLFASAQDQDDARAARERGAIAPFAQILAAAREAVSPRAVLLDAAMVPDHERSLVEVLMRERDGRVISVVVDGLAAQVVQVSRGDREAGRGPKAGNGPPSSSQIGRAGRDPARNSGRGKDSDRGGRGGGEGKGGGNNGGGGGNNSGGKR